MSRYREIDLNKIRTVSILDRKSKVEVGQFARPLGAGQSFRAFWESLPGILKGNELHELVNHVVAARTQRKKPVLWMMGAHVIKCGLSPIVIDLMRRGIITAVAMNGAGAIHDVELAYWGHTSEDVAANLENGTFGMSRETAAILNETVALDRHPEEGFGEVLGHRIAEERPRYAELSLLGTAYELGVPVTVHVALGTDIVHQHPNADGAAIGTRSMRDFRILAQVLTGLGNGGVVLHIGSTVILPEVFLKALTVARNLGHSVENFYTANFDMIQHYRPRVNVVQRPTSKGGKGYQFTGHHELMIPLLAAGIMEEMSGRKKS